MDLEQIASEILQQLEQGWNTADGSAFAAPFTEDADFVAIRGDHHRTREVIAQGHQAIFNTIYRGSTVRYELAQVRRLTDEVLLAHAESSLTSPSGPLPGTHRALASLVLLRTQEGWRITSFHNTLVTGT